MSRRSGIAATWSVVGVVVVITLAIATLGADEPTPAERVRDLSSQFACPQCDGQSVRDSDVGASVEIRAEIARGVEAGRTDDEILGALADAYGDQLLLNPPATGTSSLVWILPVAGAVLAIGGLVWAFVRWRPATGEAVDDSDRELVDAALREHREADTE
jgi:cytochrome c-type biogenesis protein CcmH